MSDTSSPDAWFDTSTVPWGSVDYGQDPGGKVDTLRKNAWAVNRAVYVLLPAQLAEINAKLDRILAKLGA